MTNTAMLPRARGGSVEAMKFVLANGGRTLPTKRNDG